MKRTMTWQVSLMALATLCAANAQAQVAPMAAPAAETAADQTDNQPSSDNAAEDIVVTGTSIRGVAPVGSAVISVGREEIEASPAVTTAQLLLETPQIFNSGISEGSRNGPGGSGNVVSATAISLRGLGSFATLTLFDGKRPVPNGTTGGFVDPSSIPTIALQRVEVIADGASAIYGSDAVAGVVNLVLRRSFDGVGIDARYGMGDNYHDAQISAIVGEDWGSGRFTLAYQHSYRSNVFGGDRDFVSSDLRSRGGADFRTTNCSPGNIVIGGVSYAIPAGGAAPGNLVAATQNRCDAALLTDLLPQQEFNSLSLTFDQDLAPGWRMWLTAYGTRRDALRLTPQLVQNLTVPRTNAFFVAPTGLNPASATVQYSFARELGPIDRTPAFSKAAQIFAGTEVKLTGDVRLQISGSYGRNRDETARAAFDTSALTAALASNNPATALNPFGTSATAQSVIDRITAFTDDIFGETRQYGFEAKLDGTLLELPGGALRFAVGAEYLNLATLTGTRRGPDNAYVYFARNLGRNVKAAYGEIYVPIIGPDNAMPGIQKLELDVAGRIEEYSDAGSTQNPKIGVNWTPVDGLIVRGSYGTSFRAPSLTQIYTPAGGGLYIRNFLDPTANNGAGGTIPGTAFFADNPNLKPETARTWSLGVDFEPSFLPRSRLSLNYFNVKYDGQIIGFLNNTSILLQENIYSALIVRRPTAAFLQSFLDQGRVIQGGTSTNYFNSQVFVYASNTNLGVTQTDGLDYQFDLSVPTDGAGEFRLRSAGTYYFNFATSPTAAAPITERVNTIDYPLRFRNRTSLIWTLDGITAMAAVNYANAYSNTSVTPLQRISSYTTVDFNIGYTFTDDSSLNGLRLGLEATNLFDRDPPFVRFNSGFDPQVANPTGRIVAVTLGKRF